MSVPEGQKNAYLVRAILKVQAAEDLEGVIRSAIREELSAGGRVCSKPQEVSAVPEQMLDFLAQMEGL